MEHRMATTALIRVSAETRDKLARIAESQNSSIGDVVEAAASKLERDLFWKQVNEAYDRLKADPEAWADYQAELAMWDSLSFDGLEEYPYEYGDDDE
jgi:hypothetical protein